MAAKKSITTFTYLLNLKPDAYGLRGEAFRGVTQFNEHSLFFYAVRAGVIQPF